VSGKRAFLDSWQRNETYQPSDTSAVYLRKNMTVTRKIKRATAFICGLGYCELYINGDKAGTLKAQFCPPMRVAEEFAPIRITDLSLLFRRNEHCLPDFLAQEKFFLRRKN
jgi:hypothetical protein